MANHYYGANIGAGADPQGVTTGTSTTSKNVEVVRALEAIILKILQGNAPA